MLIRNSIRYVTAPAPPTYPLGVIAAGAQVAYDTRTTGGLKTALLYTVAANAAMFPPGTNVTSGPNQVQFPLTGDPFTLEDFDFTGYEVTYRGASGSLNRCLFANPGGGRLLVLDGAGIEVQVTNTTFDGAGMQNVHQAVVLCGGGTKLTETDCRHVNSPKCHVDDWGRYIAIRTWFGAFGYNPGPAPHQEAIFVRQGMGHQLIDCGFDVSEFDSPAGETGILYFEASYQPTGVELTRCILYGALDNGIAYPMQLAAKSYAVTCTVNGLAIQPGPSGYTGLTEEGGNVVTLDSTNAFNYETGVAVNLDH